MTANPAQPSAAQPSAAQPSAAQPSAAQPSAAQPTLLHIAPRDRWEATVATTEPYRDPSLDAEGFIHCSTPDQLLIPANERFAGRTDLVLLVIDATAIQAPLIFEDCYESGLEFPHIYGPIPTDAVSDVLDFPPNPDGTFALPVELS